MKISFKPTPLGKFILITVTLIVAVILYKKRTTLKSLTLNTINYLKEKTWDIVSDRRINTLHPTIRAQVKEFIIRVEKELGIKLRVTSAFRTWEEQSKLYAQGRSFPGKVVTHAKAGESYHNYGLAFDVVEIKNGQAIWKNPNWQKIGEFGKKIGFSWGGDWKGRKRDKPHFHNNFGKHHTQLAVLYKSGKRNGNYVTIV